MTDELISIRQESPRESVTNDIVARAIVVYALPRKNTDALQRVIDAGAYGLPNISATSLDAVVAAISKEAALIILTEEVLANDHNFKLLVEGLNQQPEWSNISVILLLKNCRRPADNLAAIHSLRRVSSLVLLERPLKYPVFHSVVQICLANRQRQYVLQELLEQLRASNQVLENFSHTVAHELKNPLTVMTTSLELLSRTPPEAQRQKLLGMAQRTARGMAKTLDALLAYGKLKAAHSIETQSVDMMAVLEQAQLGLQQLCVERNAEVSWQALPKVQGNEQLLVQVVSNLIKNAIIHNPAEMPVVKISAQIQPQHWRFCIADNGPGIAPENQQKIFYLFERCSPQSSGSGVALALCSRIIKLHQGHLEVESELGQGSQFYFDLPRFEGISSDS